MLPKIDKITFCRLLSLLLIVGSLFLINIYLSRAFFILGLATLFITFNKRGRQDLYRQSWKRLLLMWLLLLIAAPLLYGFIHLIF